MQFLTASPGNRVRRGRREATGILEAIRWLAMPIRPGGVEELEAVLGVDRDGRRCEMRIVGPEVVVVDAEGDEQRLGPSQAMDLLVGGGFVPRAVRVKKNVTDKLFLAAVRAAEAATEGELRAEAAFRDLPDEEQQEDNDSDWHLLEAIGGLRDAVPPALQAIVFAVATAEAQVNEWGRWTGQDDFRPLEDKCKGLAREREGALTLGEGPGQWFMEALEARHEIVHARPHAVEEHAITRVDRLSQAARARRACAGVRQVLVDLARILGEEPPKYLAMSPVDPDDVPVWRTAVLLSGIRDDPVFPPRVPGASEAEGVPRSASDTED